MHLARALILSFLFIASACLKATKDGEESASLAEGPTLKKLTTSIGALNPEFDPKVREYTMLSGESAANKVFLNLAPTDDEVKIEVNGVPLRSDFTTDFLPLDAGTNTFTIDLFRAEKKANTYKLTVQRVQELQDQEITDLATSQGDPVPVFSTDIVNYEITVDKDTTDFTVSPLARYPELATIVINGKSYAGDSGGYDVAITADSTTITMEIRGQSGRTKTYTLVVKRAAS